MNILTFSGCIGMITVVILGMGHLINRELGKLQEVINNQQYQIDELKRELEELKNPATKR